MLSIDYKRITNSKNIYKMNKRVRILIISLYQNKNLIMRNTFFILLGALIYLLPNNLNADTFYYLDFNGDLIHTEQNNCDDVTDGGEIIGNQTGCANPSYDPTPLTNVVLPSGGTGVLEYIWMYTNDNPNGQSAIWKPIQGTNAPYYDPGSITETTYFTRCARREGCTTWVTESNFVCVEIDCQLPNIGDTVFNDLDGDGIQDPGEPGVSGVKVKLFTAGPDGAFCTPDDVMVTMQVTDANGMYLFTDVQPGTYYIEFCEDTLPDGFTFTEQNQGADDAADSDADPDDGKTNVFTVNFGDEDDLSYDAGIVPLPKTSLGDTVFADNNGNGVQDGGEPGVSGIKVKLFNDGPDGVACNGDDEMVDMLMTGPNGEYSFTICDADTYYVQFCDLPTGYTFTDQDAGTNDGIDSDADPNTGKTDPIDIDPSDPDNPTVDAGVVLPCDVAVSFESTDPSCSDSNDGRVSTILTGGTAPFSYSWNNGGNTASINGLTAGEYCVTVTDANGCELSSCTTLNNPISATIVFNSTNPTCAENNGAVSASANGGAAPFAYQWNTGATTNSIGNLSAGEYCVTITDANGCENSRCVTLFDTDPDFDFNLSGSDPSCHDSNDGSGTVRPVGGLDPMLLDVVWSDGQTGPAAGGFDAGEICATVTNRATGCTRTRCITLVAPDPIEITTDVTPANCGENNGSISIAASGGVGTYSYAWSNGAISSSIGNLAAGEYCVTVTDENDCTASACINLDDQDGVSFDLDIATPLCTGVSTATTVSVINLTGTAPFTFDWPGGFPNTATSVALVNGTYTLTITDANGCVASQTFIVDAPDPSTLNVNTTQPTCGENNGEIQAFVIGGTPGFSAIWNDGSTESTRTGLAPGQYCVTITDANGCENSRCVDLFDNDLEFELIATDPTCHDSNDGSATLRRTGGSTATMVTWSDGQTGQTAAGLGSGEICATAVDGNGCTQTQCITLNAPMPLEVTLSASSTTCEDNNGSVMATVEGGTAPYFYEWSNGASTPTIDNLAPGEYCVQVFDSNGCAMTTCIDLESEGGLDIRVIANDARCHDSNDGQAIVAFMGSDTGPYTFEWSDGLMENAMGQVMNLAPGDYCVTVTDNFGCVDFECFTIGAPDPIDFDIDIDNANCGEDNGRLDVNNFRGGMEPYEFIWSTGSTDRTISSLSAGEYCITVTDARNCTVERCVTVGISLGIELVLIPTDPSCHDSNDGSVTAELSGGTPPFFIEWSDGQTGTTATGLGAGEICIEVFDDEGCSTSACITLTAPTEITLVGDVTPTSCGEENGSIFTTIFGGSAPFTIDWSNGATSLDLNNLAAGEYCVEITDGNGCSANACFTVEPSMSVEIDGMVTNATCGLDNGSITVDGGFVFYSWADGRMGQTISDLPPGEYCLEATALNGCIAANCFTVLGGPDVEVQLPNTEIREVSCFGASDGRVAAEVTGGTAPFTYQWSRGGSTTAVNDGLTAGMICVTVTDANGCDDSACINLDGPDPITFEFFGVDPTCFGENDGSANVTNIMGGNGLFDIEWSNGQTGMSATGLGAGEICVTITDQANCIESQCITLIVPDPIAFDIDVDDTTCGDDNGRLDINRFRGGTGPYEFVWSTGSTNRTIDNLSPGEYCITVVDANGCSEIACVMVADSPSLEFIVDGPATLCEAEFGTFQIIGAPAGTTFTWDVGPVNNFDTGQSISVFNDFTPGSIAVTATGTDLNGCTHVVTVTFESLAPSDPACDMGGDKTNIGNYVWFDIDNDGIQDPFEQGVEGIKVKLFAAGPDGMFCTADDVMVMMQTTDSNGFYLFECVEPGEYYVEFCLDTLPMGTALTNQDTGSDDEKDSDADPSTGKTDPFTVVDGQGDDLSFDAGIIIDDGTSVCDNVLSGGEICCDQMLCGAGSIPDPITNVVSPSGGSGALEYLWMMNTDTDVFDINTWTPIPGATGDTYAPGPVFQTTFIARCVRRAGCTSYLEANIITLQVKSNPKAEIEHLPASACINEDISFNAVDGGIGATYFWDFGTDADPATFNGRNANGISWSSGGTKTITLEVSLLGCVKTVTETIDINDCGGSLISRFVNFDVAEVENGQVMLEWETREEMNDHVFMIEHANDGQNFAIIDEMEGKKASIGNKAYAFIDEDASPGRNYYKIRHIDLNTGKSESTDEEMIIVTEDNKLSYIVYPNPTPDVVVFESLKKIDEEGQITLVDALGRVLETIIIPAQTETIAVDLSKHQAGTYFLFIKYNSAKLRTQKIIKTRD